MVSVTKLDPLFPEVRFHKDGYSESHRHDRNGNWGKCYM